MVAYAKEVAAKKGIKVEFSISTNGTLMTDEKIHFLVAHEFAVSISLDGPKESHDRYRIYRNDRHPERRGG